MAARHWGVFVGLVTFGLHAIGQCGQTYFTRVIQGPAIEYAHMPLVMPNGDIVVCGHSNSFAPGGQNIVLARYDQTGQLLWLKTHDFWNDDGGLSVAIASCANGDIVLAGEVNGVSTSGGERALVARFDGTGQLLWAQRVGTSGYWHARAVVEASNGDILFCGSEDGTTNGSADGFVGRTTSGGTLLWLKTYGGTSNDHWTSIHELTTGDVVLTSTTQSVSPGNRRGWFTRVDSNGNMLVSMVYSATGNDMFSRSCLNQDGTFLNVGVTNTYGTGGANIMAIKTDASGLPLWATVFSSAGADQGLNAVQTSDLGWVISGKLGSTVCLIKLQPNGIMEWARSYPDMAVSSTALWTDMVALQTDGGFVISANGQGATSTDMVLQKVDSCGTACNSTAAALSQIFPTITASAAPIAASGSIMSATMQTVVTTNVLNPNQLAPCNSVCSMNLQASALVGCGGDSLVMSPVGTIQGGTINSWEWDLGDGTQVSGPSSVTHLYAAPGIYPVTVIAGDMAQGCLDTLQFMVTIDTTADAGLNGLVRMCPSDSAVALFPELGGVPDMGGVWLDPNGNIVTGVFQPGQDPIGIYQYVVQGGSPCADTAQVIVDYFSTPDAGTDTSLVVCVTDPPLSFYSLLAPGISPVGTWLDPSAMIFSGTFDPAVSQEGMYVYIIKEGPCEDTAYWDVSIDICTGVWTEPSGLHWWWSDDGSIVIGWNDGAFARTPLVSLFDASGRQLPAFAVVAAGRDRVRLITGRPAPGVYVLAADDGGTRMIERVVME